MSWHIVAKVYSRRVGSATRKAILAYFADKASDDGRGVWASKATIAAELEMGRSTVIRTVNDLVSDGILSVTGEHKVKNGATVEYAVNIAAIDRLPKAAKPATDPKDPSHSGTGVDVDQSQSGTKPVPERDPYPSRSGTQTSLRTSHEHPPLICPPPGFDDFWSVVPRKVAKGAAEKAWAKAVKKAPPETIIAGMRVYARSREGEDPTYTAHPATWLNAERWTDEPPPPSQPKRTTTDGRLDAAMRAAARFDEMDSGPGAYPSQPLLPAGPRRDDDRGRDFGLDFDFEAVAEGSNLRLVR